MENNIEWIRNETNLNVNEIQNQNGTEETQDRKDSIQPSIWTLQEILHFGYHPAKKLKKEELETIFNEDKKYLIWLIICVTFYTLNIIAYFTFIILTLTDILKHTRYYNIFLIGITVAIILTLILLILIPSMVSILTNTKAIWRTKEYQTWIYWKRYLWWICLPFYFLFNLEIIYQYYKNIINLKTYITRKNGPGYLPDEGLIDDEPDQALEEHFEGTVTVAGLGWLYICLHTVPVLLIYMFFCYSRLYSVFFLSFVCITSLSCVWISNYIFTNTFFITRGRNLNKYYIFASSVCSAVIVIFRVMLIEDIFLYVFIITVDSYWYHNEGVIKPIILILLVVGHWLYETVRWKLSAPEGFKGFLYTFYAGIYRTSVPDVSNFIRCIESNAIMMLEASFFYSGAKFTQTTTNRWFHVNDILVLLNHYVVVTLLLAHFCHIILYYIYKKKIAKENIDYDI